MLLAPPLFGLVVGSWEPLPLIGSSLGGGLLAYSFVDQRRWVGGVEALGFSDDGVAITRKGKTVELTWNELENAAFQSINTTPWLTFETHAGNRFRLCLEHFDGEAQRAITGAVMPRIAKRIPVSIAERSVESK